MSIQDERDLRDRLTGLLDSLDPSPAPVARVMSRGKGIRMRRWISVAAGLAVIAAGASLLPGFLQQTPLPSAPMHYKVTVQPLGKHARGGVIAAGVTDGKHWRVVLSGSHGTVMTTVKGMPLMGGGSQGPVATGWPAAFESESGGPGTGAAIISSIVSRTVTSIGISLPDGEVLSLKPVSWGGHRWVAVVLPSGVRIVRATAYSGGRELAYSVPFGDVGLNVWWLPGQVGPARLTRTIGSGVVDGVSWVARANIGPWGYCYTYASGNVCIDSRTNPQVAPAGHLVSYLTCGPLDSGDGQSTGASSGIATAALSVRKVVLKFADGTTESFPAIEINGSRVFGYAIPSHRKLEQALAYGQGGVLLGSTPVAGWKC
ncbi:MAG: hypothetical protein ACLQFR_02350 [Streptosporangiaceae bacterium]